MVNNGVNRLAIRCFAVWQSAASQSGNPLLRNCDRYLTAAAFGRFVEAGGNLIGYKYDGPSAI
jgi:hypothetical protein